MGKAGLHELEERPKGRINHKTEEVQNEQDARGAPPMLTKAANADTIMMRGIHTPTPVRAKLPSLGIWPM